MRRRQCAGVIELIGNCSIVWAPMRWEGRGVGTIAVLRQPPKPFTRQGDRAPVKTFADQAVIAIQNARLFNETQEALERQTATAEMLRVISGSVTDTQPVFDAIVQSCQRLFAGKAVALSSPEATCSIRGLRERQRGSARSRVPRSRGRSTAAAAPAACILDSRVINVADTAEGAKELPRMRDLAVALGYRSALFVPLLRDGKAIGCIADPARRAGAFDEQEVSLAQTFADQAVIAIENARLFNETAEALEQQTATGGSAASDQQLGRPTPRRCSRRSCDSCQRLFCERTAARRSSRYDDGRVHVGAMARLGARARWARRVPMPLDGSFTGQAIRERRTVQFDDRSDVPLARSAVRAGGRSRARQLFAWPGRADAAGKTGASASICVMRQPPRPFSDKGDRLCSRPSPTRR